jgi:hypothetical protein
MRKLLLAWLLILFTAPAFAASTQPAAASATPAVTLTPDQARQALAVLNDPQRRAQIADTLHAIAAAGFRARRCLGASAGKRRGRGCA